MNAGIVLPRSQPMGRWSYRGKHRAHKTSLSAWTVIRECQRYDIDEMFKQLNKIWEDSATYLWRGTCPCGDKFETQINDRWQADLRVTGWLAAHQDCTAVIA